MPAHEDVLPALALLRDSGLRLVTLTNSAPAGVPTPLARAGIDGYFERAFRVEDVRRFKPAPETYRYVAAEIGIKASEMCLVACHLWYTIGAQTVGAYGALVTRPHNAILAAQDVPVPYVIDAELTGLATKIVERWMSA